MDLERKDAERTLQEVLADEDPLTDSIPTALVSLAVRPLMAENGSCLPFPRIIHRVDL